MVRRYVGQKATIREIAAELGRSYHYVHSLLVKYDIELREPGYPPGKHLAPGVDRATVAALLEQGWSSRAVGKHVGVHHSTIGRLKKFLIEQGVLSRG